MAYVKRENGIVVGWTAHPAEGFDELLPDDHPDIVEYNAGVSPHGRDLAAEIDALKAVLVEEEPAREAKIEAKLELKGD